MKLELASLATLTSFLHEVAFEVAVRLVSMSYNCESELCDSIKEGTGDVSRHLCHEQLMPDNHVPHSSKCKDKINSCQFDGHCRSLFIPWWN
jgi:hypothetical protein